MATFLKITDCVSNLNLLLHYTSFNQNNENQANLCRLLYDLFMGLWADCCGQNLPRLR